VELGYVKIGRLQMTIPKIGIAKKCLLEIGASNVCIVEVKTRPVQDSGPFGFLPSNYIESGADLLAKRLARAMTSIWCILTDEGLQQVDDGLTVGCGLLADSLQSIYASYTQLAMILA